MTDKVGATTQGLIQTESMILTEIVIPYTQIITLEIIQMIVLEFF